MRVVVDPTKVELAESRKFTVNVTITNTGEVIGGYQLRVLGADPSWVTMSEHTLSLFPQRSQTVTATVDLPSGVGAGDRRIAVEVRELTPPHDIQVVEIELAVPPKEALRMSLTPTSVTCGKHGRFSVMAENTGNKPLSLTPVGTDPEASISFEFLPEVLDLAPGEHVIADLRTTAKRRWFGTPVVRQFSLAAVPEDEVAHVREANEQGAATRKADHRAEKQARKNGARKRHENKKLQRHAKRRSRAIARDNRRALIAGPPTASSVGADANAAGVLAGPQAPPEPPEPLAQGAIMQKPKVGRGLLSLVSLLLAVSVFAVVITIAMSKLAGQSAADRDLAIQVANAKDSSAGATGTSALGGTVKLQTDASPVRGATVDVFTADDVSTPIISTATTKDGTWQVSSMSAGKYKIRFRAANFAEVWYPNAASSDAAKTVQLNAGQKLTKLEVTLGGLPASITGKVAGADVSDSTLTVEVPMDALQSGGPPTATGNDGAAGNGAAARNDATAATHLSADDDAGGGSSGSGGSGGSSDSSSGGSGGTNTPGAQLKQVSIGSDGTFSLTDLPSPAVYDLVVTKAGFATTTQRVDLAAGETRTGIVVTLRTGDGSISGTINGPDGPLGNAVVTAASGNNTVKTLTLTTKGKVGQFTLRNLVTPATYTVTVTATGYATVTTTLNLTSGQRLKNVALSLTKSAGSISGVVTTQPGNAPAPGVTVEVSSGSSTTVSTVTQSGATAGQWKVAGLAIPGTFTITFTRDDLQPQTVSVAVNAAGVITSGADGDGTITVSMRSAFATVTGKVTQQTGTSSKPVGEATITLTSGEETYTVTSVSSPAAELGKYEVGNVKPGTYTISTNSTGTSATTVIVTLTAGQKLTYNPVLTQPASVSGVVTQGGKPLAGIEVDMYLSSQYPAEQYAKTTTDSSGRYTFGGVDAPQAYVVEAIGSSDAAVASGTIVVHASEAGVLDLNADTGSSTSGTSPTTTSAAGTSTTPSATRSSASTAAATTTPPSMGTP